MRGVSAPTLQAACVSSHTGPEWTWLEEPLRAHGVACRFYYLKRGPEGRPSGWEACRQAIAQARRAGGVLVTHGVPAALRCAALQRLASPAARVPHVAWSWHFATAPRRRDRWLARLAAPGVDAFVVHSRVEAEYQAALLNVPGRRFEVSPWPYEAGARLVLADPPTAPRDYLCTIGGSDRDYATLLAAMERLPDLPLVIAARPENLRGLRPPPNVQVHLELPKPQSWALLRDCRVFVLPLPSRSARTGHSCLVQAMAFGRPCVATDGLGLWEYMRMGETALAVPPGDPERLAESIQALWADPAGALALGEVARDFARRELSEERVAEQAARLLYRLRGRSEPPAAAPGDAELAARARVTAPEGGQNN